jgi:hypothetical protein
MPNSSSTAKALIKAKREEREASLLLAPSYDESVHDRYLRATGKAIQDLQYFGDSVGVCSFRYRRAYRERRMDRCGGP